MGITYILSQFVSQYMWVNKKSDGTDKQPWAPSPTSLPWLWNGLEDYQIQGPRILTTWAKAVGNTFFSVKLGQRRVLVLNDGPLVKHLLVDLDQYNSSKVVSGGAEIPLTDNGKTVFAASFSLYWSRIRRSIASAINTTPAAWFDTLFDTQSEKLVQTIQQAAIGNKVSGDHLRGLVDLVALETALILVMEQSQVDPELMVKVLEKVAALEQEQAKVWTQYTVFRIPVVPLIISVRNILLGDPLVRQRNELLTHFVNWTLENLNNNNNNNDDDNEHLNHRRPCLSKHLSSISASKNDPEPEQLQQDEIIINLMHLTLHSYKYLSTALFTMIQRLATLPADQQDRIRTQQEAAQAFVKESLRYDPPARAYAHASRVDQDIEFGQQKYRVDEDSELVVNLDAIHFNPDYYPDPNSFSIDRFLTKTETTVSVLDAKKAPAHDHLAFGVGRRLCQGSRVSELFLSVVVARLVQAYDLHGGNTDRVHRSNGVWSWLGREETIGTSVAFTPRGVDA
ncbi:cytochrome P450 [Chlamydoabsidia padenii]|nr:cytochrome P450 [Chlamydoabsidia padenii]